MSNRFIANPLNCPVTRTMSIIGGKWKPIILNCIGDRTIRFGKLNQIIPSISNKVLAGELKELEQYGWEPFQFALKSDINTYLEADKDLIKLLEKKVYHEEVVSVIESIMNELKQRTWQLRDFISWEKFIGGQ